MLPRTLCRMAPVEGSRFHARVRLLLPIVALSVSLVGGGHLVKMKTPSPEGPRISQLEFIPDRTTAGCPVKIRFRFDAPNGEIVRAAAGWVLLGHRLRRSDSGYSVLAVEPELFGGKTSGEVTAPLTLNHYGTYRYYVQVEDRAERTSNVLQEAIAVDAPWTSGPPKCPREVSVKSMIGAR